MDELTDQAKSGREISPLISDQRRGELNLMSP